MAHQTHTDRKRRAYRFGQFAEYYVCAYLLLKGYRISGIRTRTPVGEIDLWCTKRNQLICVEVKARHTHAQAAESLRAHQRARIRRAAEYLIATRPHLSTHAIRFDCCTVSCYMRIHHMPNAF